MTKLLYRLRIHSNELQWIPYSSKESIVARFVTEDWVKIFPEFDCDKEFYRWAKSLPNTVKILILREKISYQTFGFVALMNVRQNVIAVHGGAWGKTTYARLKIHRGMFMLFQRLLDRGAKIVSSSVNNPAAVKFMQSFGFRIFSYRYGMTHYYINKRLIINSPLYVRFGNVQHR